ncbi:MAG: hypothetical protein M9899_06700 [Bdellovibrionaceae bacterium]|nr:hypothetical protein [Pseudobdellovibrionaceae bacterium]
MSVAAQDELAPGLGDDVKPTTFYDKHGNVLPDDPNHPDVHWPIVGKEGNAAWRGVGRLDNGDGGCTTTVFQIPQCNDPTKNAQAITNGHCVKTNAMSVTFDMFHNMDPKSRVKATVSKPLYSTRNRSDIAILELNTSYQALSDKGIEAKRISKTPLQKDKKYDLVSIPSQGINPVLRSGECNMGPSVPLMTGAFVWGNAVEFSGCSATGGASGSGLFRNDELVGILNSGNVLADSQRPEPCEMGTCVYNETGQAEHKMKNFGFDVSGLHKCYKNCTLDTKLEGCPLPDPDTEFQIRADHPDSNGNWTSSLDRKFIINSPYRNYKVKVCSPGTSCNCNDPSGYGPPKEKTLPQTSTRYFTPSSYLPNVPTDAKRGEKSKLYLFCFRGVKPDGNLDDTKNITSYPIHHYLADRQGGIPIRPGGNIPGLPSRKNK